MDNERYKNIGLTLYILAALVLVVAGIWGGKGLKAGWFVALAVLMTFTLILPFPGMIFAVPIALIVWMENSGEVWKMWDNVKNKRIGGF